MKQWRRGRRSKRRKENLGGNQGHEKERRKRKETRLTFKAKALMMVGLMAEFAGPAGDLLGQGCWSWKAEFSLFLKTLILVFQPTHLVQEKVFYLP